MHISYMYIYYISVWMGSPKVFFFPFNRLMEFWLIATVALLFTCLVGDI